MGSFAIGSILIFIFQPVDDPDVHSGLRRDVGEDAAAVNHLDVDKTFSRAFRLFAGVITAAVVDQDHLPRLQRLADHGRQAQNAGVPQLFT